MTKKKSDIKKSTKISVKKKPPSLKDLNKNLKVEQDKYVRLFAEILVDFFISDFFLVIS